MGPSLLWELLNQPALVLARGMQCILWSVVAAVCLWALAEWRQMRR